MKLLLKNILFTIVVPGTVGVYVPLWMAWSEPSVTGIGLRLLGGLLLAAGAAIYAWCLWDFASYGRGTPAPIDAPKRLVRRGLYRYVRNPMYVGVLTAVVGWAVYFGSMRIGTYGLVVAVCFHTAVLVYEEPTLQTVFGDEYIRYCRSVRRWIPGKPADPNM